jgi:hypothetical protein
MSELILKGEVMGRIFNEKREAKSGVQWSNDYLVLKSDPWETKSKEVKCNFYSIKIYSANNTTNWLGTVQVGDIVECRVNVESTRDEKFEFETRSNTWNGILEKSPSLWTNIGLASFSDDAIKILQSNNKEVIQDHTKSVGNNLPETEDDLPF